MLSVAPERLSLLRRHPLLHALAIGQAPRRRERRIYFDTPESDFARHGLSLHVVGSNRSRVQRLQCCQPVFAGWQRRTTWETPTDAERPAIGHLKALAGKKGVLPRFFGDASWCGRLLPVLTVVSRQTSWRLRTENGDEVELLLLQDEVQQEAERTESAWLVLTLCSGHPQALFWLALSLLPELELRLAPEGGRGYPWRLPAPETAIKARPVVLTSEMTAVQGLQTIVGNCLAQVMANERQVIHRDAPEFVHQMRVGLRRLNSALQLFRDTLPCPPDLRSEIKWLRQALGGARDWEVLAGETLPRIPDGAPDGMAGLQQAIAQTVGVNRRQAAAAVMSPRYTQCLLSLGAWLASLEQPSQETLESFARQTVMRCHRRLQKRGRRLHQLDPEQRHRARLAAKKLRYATEFFQSLLSSRQVQPYLAGLAALQEVLGRLNDGVVAHELLGQIARRDASLAQEAGFAQGYLAGYGERELRKLKRQWKTFRALRLPQ